MRNVGENFNRLELAITNYFRHDIKLTMPIAQNGTNKATFDLTISTNA